MAEPAPEHFPLRSRGMGTLVGVAAVDVVVTIGCALIALHALYSLIAGHTSDADGGVLGGVAFVVLFGALAYLASERARRLGAAREGRGTQGSVSIEGDVLTIDAPATLRWPIELHRAWVAGADAVRGYEADATSLCSGVAKGVCVIRLREPVGLPQAITLPRVPKDAARVAKPHRPADALAIDVEAPSEAAAAIARWADAPAATEPGPVPAPAPVDRRTRAHHVAAWGAVALAAVTLFLTRPA